MTEPATSEDLTTIEAVLAAERLLEAFEAGTPEFGELFAAADRHVLGAVLAYGAWATISLAEETGMAPADVRHQTRLLVCQAWALNAVAGNV
jgi:hypothetical protein